MFAFNRLQSPSIAFKIVPIRYYALVPALLPILETLLKLDLRDSL